MTAESSSERVVDSFTSMQRNSSCNLSTSRIRDGLSRVLSQSSWLSHSSSVSCVSISIVCRLRVYSAVSNV